jgi:hypothetical protein
LLPFELWHKELWGKQFWNFEEKLLLISIRGGRVQHSSGQSDEEKTSYTVGNQTLFVQCKANLSLPL